jgi:hypothetical protein
MKRNTCILIAAILVIIAVCGSFASAARTLPPTNETTSITTRTSVAVIGNLYSNTDIVYVQGNNDLSDNPPLNASCGEGQSTISYQEDIMAISGEATYDKYTNLDTGPKTANSDNFESTQILTYDTEGDGDETGKMIADESILVETVAYGCTVGETCCDSVWGAPDGEALPATNGVIVAGSEMVVSEAAVTSSTGARITADSTSTPVSMDYSVEIEGVNQTEGDLTTGAEGTATVYVNANIQEGIGNSTAVGSEITYSDVTTASGLFNLAKEVSYTSG